MNVLLWILKAIGLLILAVIMIAVIVLLLNICVIIEYKGSLSFKIKIAFFDITKFITKDKKVKKTKTGISDEKGIAAVRRKADKLKKSVPKNDKKKSFDIHEILGIINRFLQEIKNGFLKKIVVQNARIHIISAGNDAAETAINYGRICAALYPIVGFIDNTCRVKKKDIDIKADFTQKKTTADIYLYLKLRSFHIVLLSLKIFLGGEKQ